MHSAAPGEAMTGLHDDGAVELTGHVAAPRGAALLPEVERLKQLKARYCWYLDTQRWDTWRSLFADDFVSDISAAGGKVVRPGSRSGRTRPASGRPPLWPSRIRHVDRHGDRCPAVGDDLLGHRLGTLYVDVGNPYRGTLAGRAST